MSEGLLADKLKSAVLLSPIAYLSHMETALGVIAARSFVGEVLRTRIPFMFLNCNDINMLHILMK